ncbi:serpin B [Actinopolyspora xinjiangensis]|uniref:Serpin B n=1 Tax=Actinopolyspora xinjiangensis TaxID=405564 RepID=A0A1H0UCP7_9ACTN|nr:serpin family protein [Actinopolyspora xinjiangensis]SDP63959.1 serpin B [Actinopolyspora xinjiangensis]
MNSHVRFLWRLHRRLAPDAREDFCWSPHSVAATLGLLAAVSRGRTREEVAEALGSDPAGAEFVEPLNAAAHLDAESRDRVRLAVANRLWVDERLPLAPAGPRTLEGRFAAEIRAADFHDDPERARERINADVADVTRGLVPELVEPGAVNSETVAALVNALYLKAPWHEAFDPDDTVSGSFRTRRGTSSVLFMRLTTRLGYAARHGWQVVRMGVVGGIQAFVLLPDAELATAEPELDHDRLPELLDAVEERPVRLSLPRFAVFGSGALDEPLAALGVRRAFTPAADFTPLTPRPLRVSTALHEAVLRIDEQGLEGAAATAAMMRLTSLFDDPVRVSVDRPFLFLVRHRDSGVVHFLARITDPDRTATDG